jgi:hypothetical protein
LLAPLFLGDPLWLALSESGAEVHVEVRTGERVTATADLSPEPDPDRVRGGFAGGLS